MFCASKRIQVLSELGEPPYPEDVDKLEEIPSRGKKPLIGETDYLCRKIKGTGPCSQLHQCGPIKFSDNTSMLPGEKLD